MAEKKKPLKDEEPQETPVETGEAEKNEQSAKEGSDKKKDGAVEPDIDALQEELSKEKERTLRLSAEFENYKKRISREMNDFRRFANESLFKQLLTVVDNLERAIDSGEEQNADVQTLLEGIRLTHKEIIKVLETSNVKAVEAQGKPFDPALHQAVSQQDDEEHPDNTVLTELQKGYLLHDRLIRPSMVIVSKAAAPNKEDNNKEETK